MTEPAAGWTPPEDVTLRQLWGEGHTARQIAEQIPARSRNAIMGRAQRLGLDRRPSPIVGGKKKGPRVATLGKTLQEPPPRVLDREPCPRCNVRGDVGCEHRERYEHAPALRVR